MPGGGRANLAGTNQTRMSEKEFFRRSAFLPLRSTASKMTHYLDCANEICILDHESHFQIHNE
jgi:hypothetical protein